MGGARWGARMGWGAFSEPNPVAAPDTHTLPEGITFDKAEADDGPGCGQAQYQLPLKPAHVRPADCFVETYRQVMCLVMIDVNL